ncbi:EGF-like domain, extracellular [Phytophthora cactorum]|nr:EGF-like domain, extracellular [Phytophthora cactorum]
MGVSDVGLCALCPSRRDYIQVLYDQDQIVIFVSMISVNLYSSAFSRLQYLSKSGLVGTSVRSNTSCIDNASVCKLFVHFVQRALMTSSGASLEHRWCFLAPWCEVLKGKLRYGCVAVKGGLWDTERNTLHVTIRRDDIEGNILLEKHNFQQKLRKTREALALLAALEHADYTAWRYLLTVHCGIDVGKAGEEKFEDRIPVKFLLCLDLNGRKEKDSVGYDLVKFCGVDQRDSSEEFLETMAKIAALDKRIQPDWRGIDIEIPVQVFFSTDRLKPMEVSAKELLDYGEAERIIRDEWRQYVERPENQLVARGSLRCTFVLEPVVVDFLVKRLRLELHEELWDNELESKKALGQLFTGLFNRTRRTRELVTLRQRSVLDMHTSKPDPFQLDQLQLFCISTMPASDFVALASAMAVNRTVKKLGIQLSLQGRAQITTRYWWKCLAYALFSERARTFSSHGGFAEILTSDHPEEELLGFSRGAMEERTATLKSGASIRWQFNYRGEPVPGCDPLSFLSPISFVRTFSDDGVSEWVNVLIPGYGHCQVQRENLEFYEPSWVNSGHRLTSLKLEFVNARNPNANGLPLLLAAIGTSLNVLTLKVHNMELSVPSILRSCPNLSELSLSGDMVDIQLILNQSHPIRQSRREFRLNLDLIVSLSRSLSNTSNLLPKSVRRLRVRPINRLLRGQFDPQKFNLRPTHNTRNLSLESTIAFISAVLAPTTATQAVRNVVQERSSLHKLSQDMLCQIFTYAQTPVPLQVFIRSQSTKRVSKNCRKHYQLWTERRGFPVVSRPQILAPTIAPLNMQGLVYLLLVLLGPIGSEFVLGFSCDGGCSGHGACQRSTGRCTCFPGFGGATCASRLCPTGAAWVDRAWAVDKAHQPSQCSAMGRCDRSTGACTCESGFEGVACERLSCPNLCSGNGRCISMRDAATLQDDRNFFVSTTYSLWDADKIMGCQCDPGFTGFDCSQRECPKGDNPLTTGQAYAIQDVTCVCNTCTGTFALSFRGRVTANLASTATSSDLKIALEALDNIYGVSVVAATPLCSTSGTITSIIFTNNPGDLPKLHVINNLSNGATVAVGTSQVGTRENAYCSNRGSCDFATGVCKCVAGFASGDGAMPPSAGRRGDCGYQSGLQSVHQPTSVCAIIRELVPQRHPTNVSAMPALQVMIARYASVLKELHDTAHAMAECSGRGSCNTATGLCICLSPFTGAACDLIRCPIGTSSVYGATCSGRGTCKSIQQLSSEATDPQGNPLGLTYGATPNTLATWDAAKIQGCDCETNDYFGPYENAFGDFTGGHDCSARMCPRGADPFEVGKVNEKQTLTCTADAGEFTLTFRGETTPVIPFNAGTAQVQATLQTLESVRTATITFNSGSVVCSATGVTTTVEFTFMQGDLSPLSYDASALTLASNPGTLAVGELVKGTKANVECSARGVCGTSIDNELS